MPTTEDIVDGTQAFARSVPKRPHGAAKRPQERNTGLIHLSVAVARFIETLLLALLRAGLSLAGVIVLALVALALGYVVVRRALRRSRDG